MEKTVELIQFEKDMGSFVNLLEKQTMGKCFGFPEDCKGCTFNQSNLRNPEVPPCKEV